MPSGRFERMMKDSKGTRICLRVFLDLLNDFITDDLIYQSQERERAKH
jgi:hypothetical protein